MRSYDYESLLMDYACGALDEALAMVIASHLTLNPRAREQVALCESLGGALIDECCGETCMSENSLKNVLDRLDRTPVRAARMKTLPCATPCGVRLPAPLGRFVGEQTGRWLPIWPGISIMPVSIPRESGWRGLLVRACNGARPPFFHRHNNAEFMLVLHGGLQDGDGSYGTGDLFIVAPGETRRPVANGKTGCVCLVLTAF